jgi:hypothetical protein
MVFDYLVMSAMNKENSYAQPQGSNGLLLFEENCFLKKYHPLP